MFFVRDFVTKPVNEKYWVEAVVETSPKRWKNVRVMIPCTLMSNTIINQVVLT